MLNGIFDHWLIFNDDFSALNSNGRTTTEVVIPTAVESEATGVKDTFGTIMDCNGLRSSDASVPVEVSITPPVGGVNHANGDPSRCHVTLGNNSFYFNQVMDYMSEESKACSQLMKGYGMTTPHSQSWLWIGQWQLLPEPATGKSVNGELLFLVLDLVIAVFAT
ncbi:unnamed protein product [Dibothriocephalus latus]|uniref:Uncharacterized protein n=1 Tax=Dibothriocephalus latus TaxID=60516 RepID=A0A3P7N9U2_DIBLA|nr:unnamed protein product [Dibothriocephalus latus]